MGLRKGFLLLFAFLVIFSEKSIGVQLNSGGYDNILIAIDPDVSEDIRILENIQDMVKEATHYLFNATKKRIFIRSVKILIPVTWTSKDIYQLRQRETYEKAEVVIANPYLKYGDDPYTLQYGDCGEQGKYIHLTPGFLLKDNLISVYGPRGRVFVHEWAHLRWGVFDEYNSDKPYYISGNLTIEATRCSVHVNGTNVMVKRTGQSCEARTCKYDPHTNLFEKGCAFFPKKNQLTRESIMHMQALPSVSEFCDESNHNIEAPTPQNKICNSRSIWDIIRTSQDIISTPPMENNIYPEPSFSFLQYKGRVVTLLIDVSGTMGGNNRIGRVFQAADIFLTQIIETGSYIGIVEFSSYGFKLSDLKPIISNEDRENMKLLIPHTTTNRESNTCEGLRCALEVNKHLYGSAYGTEIILVTDEEDSSIINSCNSELSASGSAIHIIALGKQAAPKLDLITDMTGGLKYFATDKIDTNDLIDAFTGMSAQNGNIFQKPIQLESTSLYAEPDECLNGTVFVDETVGNETCFVITWQMSEPTINLVDPQGKIFTGEQFTSNLNSNLSRFQIPGTAENGPWAYSVCNHMNSPQAIGIIVTSKAANESMPPLTVTVFVNTATRKYPKAVAVYASVNRGLLPVKGAKVTAFIEHESGRSLTLELFDNGAGADIAKNDGIYSKYFINCTGNGRYKIKVRAEGKAAKSRLAITNNALYLPGYVENSKIFLNPERPTQKDDVQLVLGSFTRIATNGSFTISNIYIDSTQDNYKPCKITDLEAKIEINKFVLTWTATGDDLDQGKASSYDLRMSVSLRELRDNFADCSSVDISIAPQSAGSRETFEFVPPDLSIKNGTNFYFALVAIDKTSKISDMSNIAQAVVLIPPTPATLTKQNRSTGI
ncbi:hypothetical protein XENTR_v10011781 [Xenopus tropicalis]|uniref:Calcium-activated chloride channel regulator 1 n=1 Tax=Xenopus tropicalis TaxID=8364 RepID=A0A6I8PWZ4_XENTR|nr:calcium-activated chloride channel regulator 1 [Xenopus tropicalis]KAE8609339.1 hypothetical protein XENTR_v10011781 [Xenopus tropicalis]